MRHTRTWILTAALALLFTLCCAAAWADTLRLPDAVTEIGEEAFSGDTSLDKVILPQGLRDIHSRAFADSSLRQINLPDAIGPDSVLADDAFAETPLEYVIVNDGGGFAANWARSKGYNVVAGNNFYLFAQNFNDWIFVPEGERAALATECIIFDAEGLRFEWYHVTTDENGDDVWGDPLPGADGRSAVTAPIYGRERYVCVGFDAYGNRRDQWFDVMVDNNLKIWSALENRADWAYAPETGTARLSVDASADNDSVLRFQWYRVERDENHRDEWFTLDGETGKNLTTGQITGTMRYVCRVTDGYGSMQDMWFTVEVDPGDSVIVSGAAKVEGATSARVPLTYSIDGALVQRGYRIGVAFSENAADIAVGEDGRLTCMDWTWGGESEVGGPANGVGFDGWLDEMIPGHTYWYSGVIVDSDGNVVFLEDSVRRFTTRAASEVTPIALETQLHVEPPYNGKTALRFTAQDAGWYAVCTDRQISEIAVRHADMSGPRANDNDIVLFYADKGETLYLFVRNYMNQESWLRVEPAELPEDCWAVSGEAREISGAQAWVDFEYGVTAEAAAQGYRVGVAFSLDPQALLHFNDEGRFDCAMWDCWGHWEHDLRVNGAEEKLLDELVPNTRYFYTAYIESSDNRVVAWEYAESADELKSFVTGSGADIPALAPEEWYELARQDKAAMSFTPEEDGIYCVYTDRHVDELKVLNDEGYYIADRNDGSNELYFPGRAGVPRYIFARDWNDDTRLAVRYHAPFAENCTTAVSLAVDEDGSARVGSTWADLRVNYAATIEAAQQGYQICLAFSQTPGDLELQYGNFPCDVWDWNVYWNAVNDVTVPRFLDQLLPGRTYYVRAFLRVDGMVFEDSLSEVITVTTPPLPEAQQPWLEPDTTEGFPPNAVVLRLFRPEQSGLYELRFGENVQMACVRQDDGKCRENYNWTDTARFYAHEGETLYIFLYNNDRSVSFTLTSVGAAPEADAVRSEVEVDGDYRTARVWLDISEQTARGDYGYGVQYCASPDFDMPATDFFWRFGDYRVRLDDRQESGFPPLIPGQTYYYRGFIQYANGNRLYEPADPERFVVGPGDLAAVPALTVGEELALQPNQDFICRFEAPADGFYSVVADGMYWCNIYDYNGVGVAGSNQYENEEGRAVMTFGIPAHAVVYVCGNLREGGSLRVAGALDEADRLSETMIPIQDGRAALFAAPEDGWYNLYVNRSDLTGLNFYRNSIYNPEWIGFDDGNLSYSIYLEAGEVCCFFGYYDSNRGELYATVEPAVLPEEDSVTTEIEYLGAYKAAKIWLDITEETASGGYAFGVQYSTDPDFNYPAADLIWYHANNQIRAGEMVEFGFAPLIPGVTYYYRGFVEYDQGDGERLYEPSDPERCFTVPGNTDDVEALPLGEWVELPTEPEFFYGFTPDEEYAFYTVEVENFDWVTLRDASGIGAFGNNWREQENGYAALTLDLGPDSLVYIMGHAYEGGRLRVMRASDVLPRLSEEETLLRDNRFVCYTVPEDGWYNIRANRSDLTNLLAFRNVPGENNNVWVNFNGGSCLHSVYLDGGETYFFTGWYDMDRGELYLSIAPVEPPEENAVWSAVDTDGDIPVATVWLNVTEELAGQGYGFGVEYCPEPDFREKVGQFFWFDGGSAIRSGEGEACGLTQLIPGATYYYRAFIDPDHGERIYEPLDPAHCFTVPGSVDALPALTVDSGWMDFEREGDVVLRFTAPADGFYAIEGENIHWFNLFEEDGVCFTGTNPYENEQHRAAIAFPLHEGDSVYVCAHVNPGATRFRVTDEPAGRIGTVYLGDDGALRVWDNRYFCFTAPAAGWYNLVTNRTDFNMALCPTVDARFDWNFYGDVNKQSFYVQEPGETIYFIAWFNEDEELWVHVDPVPPAERDEVSLDEEYGVVVGDTWADLPLRYSVTEATQGIVCQRQGYQVGVVYSDAPILFREDGSYSFSDSAESYGVLAEDWGWDSRFTVENNAQLWRTLDRLRPSTTYYYFAYIRDNATDELYAHTDVDSFTTNTPQGIVNLSLGREVAVPADDGGYTSSVYIFVPNRTGVYALVSEGLNDLEIRGGTGHWLAGGYSDDWNNRAYPYCQGFIGLSGETYLIYVGNHFEGVKLHVGTAEELPALSGDWSDRFDGRQVFRFTAPADGWYRFAYESNSGDGALGFAEPDRMYENNGWPRYGEGRQIARWLKGGQTVYPGCWFDEDWARVSMRVTAFTPAAQPAVSTLEVNEETITDVSAVFAVMLQMPELAEGERYTYGVNLMRADDPAFAGGEAWHEVDADMSMIVWNQTMPLEPGYVYEFNNRPLEPDTAYWYEAFVSVYDPDADADHFLFGGLKKLKTAPMRHDVTEIVGGGHYEIPGGQGDYQFFDLTVPEEGAPDLYNILVPDSSIWVILPNGNALWPEPTPMGLHVVFPGKGYEGQTFRLCLQVWNERGTSFSVQPYNANELFTGANQKVQTGKIYRFVTPTDGEYLIGATDGGRVAAYTLADGGFNHWSSWGWITDTAKQGETVLFCLDRDENDWSETTELVITPLVISVHDEGELREAAAAAAQIAQVEPYFELKILVDDNIKLTENLTLSTAVQLYLNANLSVCSGTTLTSSGDIYIMPDGSLIVSDDATLSLSGIGEEWWATVALAGGYYECNGTLKLNDWALVNVEGWDETTQWAIRDVPKDHVQLFLQAASDDEFDAVLAAAEEYRYVSVDVESGYSPDFGRICQLPNDRSVIFVHEGTALVVPDDGEVYTYSTALRLQGASLTVEGNLVIDSGVLVLEGGSFVNNGSVTAQNTVGGEGNDAVVNWWRETGVVNNGSLTFLNGSRFQISQNDGAITTGIVENNGSVVFNGGVCVGDIRFEGDGTVAFIEIS